MSHPQEVKDRAIRLRREGKSYLEIEREIGVAQGSFRPWLEAEGLGGSIRPGRIFFSHPPELKDRVIALEKSGMSYREISERVGLPIGTVGSWIRDAGGRPAANSNAVKIKALELRRSGMTQRDAADAAGVPRSTAMAWFREAGLGGRIRDRIREENLQASRIKRARMMRSEGWMLREIGDAFGVTPQAVAQWLKGEDDWNRDGIRSQPIRVSEYVFDSPAEAADNFLWEESDLISALASGEEVFRGEAIGLANAALEAVRLRCRGEEAEQARETPWYEMG